MHIAIWGRDGIGKSTLCYALGILFAKKNITAVIDTDLTQPTLPIRLSGKRFDAETSLGKAVSGIGTKEAAAYLHQHTKHKRLFYAGLTDRDEYMSYELGLDADDNAQDFIDSCSETADTVIIDLSGQRTDPFVPCALINADRIIILFTTDVQGICWLEAVKPLLETMKAQERILPVAVMTNQYQNLSEVEKAAGVKLTAALPFVKELRRDAMTSPLEGTTLPAIRYAKQVQRLYAVLNGGD